MPQKIQGSLVDHKKNQKSISVKMVYRRIGAFLRRWREADGRSQGEVAEELGLPQQTLSLLEAGEQRAPAHLLIQLWESYRLDPREVLGIKEGGEIADLSRAQRATLANLSRALVAEGELVDLSVEQLREILRPFRAQDAQRSIAEHRRVRLFRIAAGRGIEVVRGADEIAVPVEVARNLKDCYALLVSGDSMIEAEIFDGDVILIRKNPDPPEGSIVAAVRDDKNEATLKRFYRRGELLELRPAHPTMKPLKWPAAESRIDGVFVGVISRARTKG